MLAAYYDSTNPVAAADFQVMVASLVIVVSQTANLPSGNFLLRIFKQSIHALDLGPECAGLRLECMRFKILQPCLCCAPGMGKAVEELLER